MGFTWENDTHLYYRRAKASEIAFGDATFHRERIAQMVIDRVAAVSPIWDLDAVAAAQIAEAAEQPEIETNPSPHTSMPTDQIQPPLQQSEPEAHLTKDVSTTQKAKPSVSKLNVEAKEFKFDPKAAFLSTNFQFSSTAFQPAAAPAQLNAAAPEFQPSTTTITRPSANKFNFPVLAPASSQTLPKKPTFPAGQ